MTWHDAAHVGIGHRPKASKTSLVGHKAGAPVVPANFYQCLKQTLETLETKGLGVLYLEVQLGQLPSSTLKLKLWGRKPLGSGVLSPGLAL